MSEPTRNAMGRLMVQLMAYDDGSMSELINAATREDFQKSSAMWWLAKCLERPGGTSASEWIDLAMKEDKGRS